MTMGVFATKLGMTQIFIEDGVRIPVTVLKVDSNTVVSKRTKEKDGYCAIQLGVGEIREKLLNKPRLGYFKKMKVKPSRQLREFRVGEEDISVHESGAQIGIEFLKDVKSVDVAGISKGKGFAGVMKRYNFSGFRATHGTHESFRGGGSIGQCTQPGRVFKGKKMPGQMGNERVKVLNLRVIKVMEEEGVICLRGAVPGAKGAVIELCPSSRTPCTVSGIAGAGDEGGQKNPVKASKIGSKR